MNNLEKLIEKCPSKYKSGAGYIIEEQSPDDVLKRAKGDGVLYFYSRWYIPVLGVDRNRSEQAIRNDITITNQEVSDLKELFRASFKYMQSVNQKNVQYIKKSKETIEKMNEDIKDQEEV